jgi:beta-phosphoglucomutase
MLHANIHNLLFDFDGTLADSVPLHAQAIVDVLTMERPDLLAAFSYEPLKGLTTAEAFRKLGIGEEPQLSRCVITKQQKYRRLVGEGHLLLLPGARFALDVAQANKRSVFLVTSGSTGSVSLALAKLGIADFFEAIVTSDDVPRGKPAPDPYRFCIEKFGLTLAQSIAIEDSPSGVCSARAAGLRVIGVNNPEIRTLVNCFFPDINLFAESLSETCAEDIQR